MAAKYTFTRSSVAYLSDGTQVAANVPRFEPGKFGKSVMVEEGTTNIIPIADWNAQNGWALAWGTQTRTIETTGLLFNGVNIIKSVIESTGQAVIYKDFAVSTTPGVVYTISAFVKSQGRPVMIWCHDGSNNGQVYSSPNVPGTDFTRLAVKFTTTGTGYCRVHFLSLSGNVGDIVWVTVPQLEQKTYATSFIDGTRAAETPEVPTEGVLNPQEGTIECWVMAQDLYVRRRDIFTVNEPVATQDRIILGYNVTGTGLELNWRPANAAQFFIRATDISPDTDWVHVGFRYKWNGTGYDLALIYNGQVVSAGIATNGQMTNFINAFLGCTKNGSIYTYFANMLFDDLRISSRARSDAEILAAYQSGRPAPIDESTTLKLNFDPFDNADIMIYNDGLVLPFYMQSSRNTKWQLIAPARDDTEEKEAADGDVDFGTTLANSELSLHGIIEYESIQDKNTKKAALAARLNDCRNKKLLALESNPDIGIYVRLKGRPEITEYPSWMDVTIPFSADPFWQSIEEHCCVGSGILTNNGTFETPLVIEITGPATNPSVVVGGQTLTYTGTVPSGQKLIIDTGNQTVKLNGVNALDKYNDIFPMLQPGNIDVTAASGGTTVFKWRDRWL